MQKNCSNCGSTFEVTQEDLTFLERVSPVFQDKKYPIPPPTLCSGCRLQRRRAFRNCRKLYKRKCDLTGEEVISVFSPDKPHKVYGQEAWYGDDWNPLDHGRDFDFSRTFFEQFKELSIQAPHWSKIAFNCENSDYCLHSGFLKNCYLTTSSIECEECHYSYRAFSCTHCLDCSNLHTGELCYSCIDSELLNNCLYLQNSKQCRDSAFCFDCASCSDCLLCVGLRNKKHCIRNQQLPKEEYEKERDTLLKKGMSYLIDELEILKKKTPHRALHNFNSEDCTGDFIFNSKNIIEGYFMNDSEDSKYVQEGKKTVLSQDCSNPDEFVECYEVESSAFCNRVLFCDNLIANNSFYCSTCIKIDDCFGCVGLHKKQYCILNKQYTKEEYEELVPKIIEHMKKENEWGEFFPVEVSPFAYNETMAQEDYTMTKEEVTKKGWNWRDEIDEIPKVEKIIPADKLPAQIDDIPDDVLNWAIKCEATDRPFRIVKQELEFYRRMKLPIPHFHPDERHKRRMALRNPRKLWDRKCDKCSKEIQTTYSPERPEKVYCEECYLKEVY